MPQARSGGSGGSGSSSRGRSTRSSSSSRSSGAKSSGAKSSGGSRSSGGRSSASRSSSSRSSASRSSRSSSSRAKRSTSGTSRRRSTASASATPDPRLDAAAQRLRKLNERIIEAGREAGETTLTSYERALKAIATTIEKGPGSSDIDWVANLATAQAKFIRDLTSSWTARARKALK